MTNGAGQRDGIGLLDDDESADIYELLPRALNMPAPVVDEASPGSRFAGFLKLHIGHARGFVVRGIEQEAAFGHLFYWSPILLGSGAAIWLASAKTPALATLLFICVVSSVAWLFLGPWRPVARAIALSAGLLAVGGLLAALETFRSETVILDSAVTTTVRGIVQGKEIDAAGRWRYEIALVETERPSLKRKPTVVRITALGKGDGIAIGAGIEGRARISPPSGPALAGLNDFAFDSYFEGNGAFGYFYGKPKPWAAPDTQVHGFRDLALQQLNDLRNAISARIHSILPGDTGAFAASMVTDDRRALSKETTEALRLAGLTHIIAISGLNMALAAGLFFVGLRFLLSLSQEISHRLPVKKIAAAGALVTVTLYYLISGFSVSAERAYIMMAIMLIAAICGRPSISLRNVALSAIVIMLMSPSAVTGPGFQMSYAATLALVAGYSAWQRRSKRHARLEGIPAFRYVIPVWNFMAGVFMTSLIGGLSTALFSIEHFHRLAAWGLPANLLAMPIISFVVMPAGLVALILMPFGLDWLVLPLMGIGLDMVIAVAKWAASLGGDWLVGRIPGWLFFGLTLGLAIMAVMRSRLRLVGAGLCAGLMAGYMLLPPDPKPVLLVFEDGSLVGMVSDGHIALSESRPSTFIVEQWQRALGLRALVKPARAEGKTTIKNNEPGKPKRLTKEEIAKARSALMHALSKATANQFLCQDKQWCVGRLEAGHAVVIALNGGYAGLACDIADIVITPARLKWKECRSGAQFYSASSLRQSGSLEFYQEGSDDEVPVLRVVGAMEGRDRPWTRHRAYDWKTDSFESAELERN